MVYTAAFEPKVIRTYPRNLGKKLPNDAVVTVDFNTDLDRDHINPYVLVADEAGNPIAGTVTYNERAIKFVPSQPFISAATVRVTIVGDDLSGKNLGVRSVLGERMRGNYEFSFTVIENPLVAPPTMTHPLNQSVIRANPVLEFTATAGADHYQIQVSKQNNFAAIIWPADWETYIANGGRVEPDMQFEDGIYYWRMRSVDASGVVGPWSKTFQFNKDTQVEGTVSDGDTLPPEIPVVDRPSDYADDFVEILEVFPQENFSNVATNLKAIYVRLMGTWTKDQVEKAFCVTGERVDGDDTDPTLVHGEVEGFVEVIPDGETTIVVFTPSALEVTES